jgi:hypothetical protein
MNLTDITVTRKISAPADKVFDLWMNPASPGGPWFGAERVILNPTVDGALLPRGEVRRSNLAARDSSRGNFHSLSAISFRASEASFFRSAVARQAAARPS